jgi:hypothetical protein
MVHTAVYKRACGGADEKLHRCSYPSHLPPPCLLLCSLAQGCTGGLPDTIAAARRQGEEKPEGAWPEFHPSRKGVAASPQEDEEQGVRSKTRTGTKMTRSCSSRYCDKI